MRFLIDNSLSPRFAEGLAATGHDAVHVRDRNLADADDDTIFDLAFNDDRTIIALDSDFGTILAIRSTPRPSVILFRTRTKSTEFLLRLLISNLTTIEADVHSGSAIVFEDHRIRLRKLPIL